jgi:poly-gamma-glutamate capsule biosynthesis protein CapA/YwtB (metallophosphatase superfamily)
MTASGYRFGPRQLSLATWARHNLVEVPTAHQGLRQGEVDLKRRTALKWIGTAAALGVARLPIGALGRILHAQTATAWTARLAALPKPAADEIVIAAVGDMMINDPVSNRTLPEAQALYEVIRDADVAFGNCEGTLASRGVLRGGLPQTARPEILDDFKTSGFDMLSLANNHALDLGEVGLLQEIEEAKKRGLTIAGAGRNLDEATTAGVSTVKGQRVGLLAFLCAPEDFQRPDVMAEFRAQAGKSGIGLITGERVSVPGSPIPLLLPQASDMRTMTEAVRRARAQVDVLMVSFHQHWNVDAPPGADRPQRRQAAPPHTIVPAQLDSAGNQVAEGRKLICRSAVDAGADLVVGHGPHVLNGVEMYKGKPILYSLGHFYMQILRDGKALPKLELSPSLARLAEDGWYLEEYRWSAVARVFVRRGAVTRVQVLPAFMDVQKNGYPVFPSDADAQTINAALHELSRPFQTELRTAGWYSEALLKAL